MTTTSAPLYEASDRTSSPEMLVAAVLHLMSHYNNADQDARPCVKLASVIERHLKALADRNDLAPVLRATCEQLSEQWARSVDRKLPPPPSEPSPIMRLFGRIRVSRPSAAETA